MTMPTVGELSQIVEYLRPAWFPGDREELLAAGVRSRAPLSVLQQLYALPSHKSWDDARDLLHELGIAPVTSAN